MPVPLYMPPCLALSSLCASMQPSSSCVHAPPMQAHMLLHACRHAPVLHNVRTQSMQAHMHTAMRTPSMRADYDNPLSRSCSTYINSQYRFIRVAIEDPEIRWAGLLALFQRLRSPPSKICSPCRPRQLF